MRQSKLLSVLISLALALVVLTGSVAVPILCRPFYYAQIAPLGLEDYTGLTEEQIRTVYDQVMDYCLGRTERFSAGVLPFSGSGADHFADVQRLFVLDLWVLAGCALVLVIVLLLCRWARVRPHRFLGRGPGFWAATGLGAVFLALGVAAAADFDRAFTVFHTLFFPGKDNWIFDWRTDPVILILPQEFFRNCALLILALLLLWCGVLIGVDLWAGRQGRGSSGPDAHGSGCPGRSGR